MAVLRQLLDERVALILKGKVAVDQTRKIAPAPDEEFVSGLHDESASRKLGTSG